MNKFLQVLTANKTSNSCNVFEMIVCWFSYCFDMTTKAMVCLQNHPKVFDLIFGCLTLRDNVCIHLENFIFVSKNNDSMVKYVPRGTPMFPLSVSLVWRALLTSWCGFTATACKRKINQTCYLITWCRNNNNNSNAFWVNCPIAYGPLRKWGGTY